ncbi:hypothetical protein JQK87_04095 [Streptomyces sp. G44]|uniref:hypothetical protein n=1 Tax=Streptomyces sp. G44 TaxID=2807632 RepID=UPI0019615B4A|nr:hypothetical protein [Streptomyces sp. G44]MBM7167600.1 hypothetical protein [Streptomyces sp. G44]
MTASASTGGTPEPRPRGGEHSVPEPTGRQGGSDPTAPSAAHQPVPHGSPDTGGGADESLGAITFEALGADPAASRRKKTLWLSVTATVGFLSVLGGTLLGYYMIKPNVTRENESNKGYDASQAPFTASVQTELGDPGQDWVMVLDRELTKGEARRLTSTKDPSVTLAYLKSLGGRLLTYASYLEHAPEKYKQWTSADSVELSGTFKLKLLSTRSAPVVIDDWQATDITCRPSSARTVVGYPSQGGVAYQGIRVHVPPRSGEPVLTDRDEGQGEPYFDTHVIELGNGQSSGALRVEAIASAGQTCEWSIKVHYVDAYQKEEWLQLKDSSGKTLRIRTESAPADPRQAWVFGAVPWTACHQKTEEPMCDSV